MFFPLLVLLLLVVGYFFPVSFRLRFCYREGTANLRLSMEVLHGLLRKEHDFFAPEAAGGEVRVEKEIAGPEVEKEVDQRRFGPAGLMARIGEFRERLRQFGLGGTLFSYFVPARFLPWMHVADWLEQKGRFTRLQWRSVVGVDDAAATALLVGLTWALKGFLLSNLDRRYHLQCKVPRIGVEPSFADPRFSTDVDCIFRLRVGHIIYAGARGFFLDKLQRSVVPHDE